MAVIRGLRLAADVPLKERIHVSIHIQAPLRLEQSPRSEKQEPGMARKPQRGREVHKEY
jgi:hypothetical protein